MREEWMVDPWIGLGLRRSFRDVLGREPTALDEASRARPYLALAFGGWIGFAYGIYLSVTDQLKSGERYLSGGSGEGSLAGPAIMGLGVVVAFLGNRLAQNHLIRGVEIFNARQREAAAALWETDAPRLFGDLRQKAEHPSVAVGIRWRRQ
jgi:hypothetical protein